MNILSQNIAYAFTIRKNVKKSERPDVKESDYYDFITMLDTRFDVKSHVYETDSKGRLHVHGIVEMPKSQKYTELKMQGFSTRFKKIYNMKGWVDYISKDQEGKLARELRSKLSLSNSTSSRSRKSVINVDVSDSPIDMPDDGINIVPKKKLF